MNTAATAALAPYILDEPAGENGQYPYGLAYSADEAISENSALEKIEEKYGISIEWAGSPDENEDGSGYWPFRVEADE